MNNTNKTISFVHFQNEMIFLDNFQISLDTSPPAYVLNAFSSPQFVVHSLVEDPHSEVISLSSHHLANSRSRCKVTRN